MTGCIYLYERTTNGSRSKREEIVYMRRYLVIHVNFHATIYVPTYNSCTYVVPTRKRFVLCIRRRKEGKYIYLKHGAYNI